MKSKHVNIDSKAAKFQFLKNYFLCTFIEYDLIDVNLLMSLYT
jgi:hypothetical protein